MRYLLVFILLGIGLSSCTFHRVNLVKTGTVTLEHIKPENVYVHSSVLEDAGTVMIHGTVSKGVANLMPIPGHMDIKISQPQQPDIVLEGVKLRQQPGPRHSGKSASYIARLPSVLSPGSKVKVAYDVNVHVGEALPD